MSKTRKLVECAIMVALATVLGLISLFVTGFLRLPYGGSVTLCGMLPVVLIGYRNGVKWGLLSGFVLGFMHLLFLGGVSDMKGISAATFAGSLMLDFFIAFALLGLSGIFKTRINSAVSSFAVGTAFALSLRYLAHFISGVILFSEYANWFFTEGDGKEYGGFILDRFSGFSLSVVYSLIYNGLYMIPEIIITTLAAFLIAKFAPKSIIIPEN